MKNTKFFVSTLIAAAAMTATAYSDGSTKGVSWEDDVSAGTRTFTGTVDSGKWVCINGDETSYSSISTDVHTLVFDSVSPSGNGSVWFTNTPVVTQNIQLKGTGLVIDGGTRNGPAVFTGNFLAGDKDASFTWNDDAVGNAQGYRFEGDMTAFNGSFSRMTATSGGDLFFGKQSAVSYSSTATDEIISNISGSGSISTTAGVVYNYAAGGDIYTTLSVNNSSIVAEKLTFQGGASYAVSSEVTLSSSLVVNSGVITFAEGSSLAFSGMTATSVAFEDITESGLQTKTDTYTIATGTGTLAGLTISNLTINGSSATGINLTEKTATISETWYNIASGDSKNYSDIRGGAVGFNVLGTLDVGTTNEVSLTATGTGLIKIADDSATPRHAKISVGDSFAGTVELSGQIDFGELNAGSATIVFAGTDLWSGAEKNISNDVLFTGTNTLYSNSNALTLSGDVTWSEGATFDANGRTVKFGAGDITISADAKVTLSGENDAINYNVSNTITVKGTWDLSTSRQTIGSGNKIFLESGVIEGTNGNNPNANGDGYGGLDFFGGNTLHAKGNSEISAAVRIRGDLTVDVSTGGELKISGTIDPSGDTQKGSNDGGIVKVGGGTLILSGANSNANGQTTINAGKLIAASANALGTGAVVVNGGVLDFNFEDGKTTLTNVTTTGDGKITVTAGTVEVNANTVLNVSTLTVVSAGIVSGWENLKVENLSYKGVALNTARENSVSFATNGVISVAGKDLVWNGAGESDMWNTSKDNTNWTSADSSTSESFYNMDNVSFAGTGASTVNLAAGETVAVGTMSVTKGSYTLATAKATRSTISGKTLFVSSGATLAVGDYDGNPSDDGRAVILDFDEVKLSGKISYNNGPTSWSSLEFCKVGDDSAQEDLVRHLYIFDTCETGLTIEKTTVSENAKISGSWGGNISLGTLTLKEGKTLTLQSGNVAYAISSVTGSGNLVNGGGNTTLSGDNSTFSGGVDVVAGTLKVSHSNALGNAKVTVSGGTLEVGSVATTLNAVTMSSGTICIAGAETVTIGSGISGGSLQLNSSSVSLDLDGELSLTQMTIGSTAPTSVSIDFGTSGKITATQNLNFETSVKTFEFTLTLTDGQLNELNNGSDVTREILLGQDNYGIWNFGDRGTKTISITNWDNSNENYVGLITDTSTLGAGEWGYIYTDTSSQDSVAIYIAGIPEPSAFGLLAGVGALALCVSRRRRVKKA